MTETARDPLPDPVPETDCDPHGLIRAAYAVRDISIPECRARFLEWVLSLPDGLEPALALHDLLLRHGGGEPDHPMTVIISNGLATSPVRRRRSAAAERSASSAAE